MAVNGSISNLLAVRVGIDHKVIVGSILFNIFTEDVFKGIEYTLIEFMGDTKL